MPKYVILVSVGDGENVARSVWERARTIEASSGDAAIGKLRDASPDLKTNTAAHFVAVNESQWRPRRMRRQLVEKWALDDADRPDDEPQGTLA